MISGKNTVVCGCFRLKSKRVLFLQELSQLTITHDCLGASFVQKETRSSYFLRLIGPDAVGRTSTEFHASFNGRREKNTRNFFVSENGVRACIALTIREEEWALKRTEEHFLHNSQTPGRDLDLGGTVIETDMNEVHG